MPLKALGSLSDELTEGADHFSVDSLSLDPDALHLPLQVVRCLLGCGCLLSRCLVFVCLTLHRLAEFVEQLLNLLHLGDNGHVLLNELLLGTADLRDEALLPVLDFCLLVSRTHQLLLHREVAHMLLLERVDQKSDARLTVLGLDQVDKFTLHHLDKLILLLPCPQCRGHSPERGDLLLDRVLLVLELRSENHVSRQ